MAFMQRHRPQAPERLRELLSRDTPVLYSTLNPDTQWEATAIMTDLNVMCTGKALRIVQSCEEPDNGVEAWRLLAQDVLGGGSQRGV